MLHGSTERLHHLAKIYEERIAPLLNPVFSRYRIGTLAKWATISIDVLLVDTITNAIHSRSRHSVICWALNGFVVNLTAASSPNKMIHCDGR